MGRGEWYLTTFTDNSLTSSGGKEGGVPIGDVGETAPRAVDCGQAIGIGEDCPGASAPLPEGRLASPHGPVDGSVLGGPAVVRQVQDDGVVEDSLQAM